jgi:HEAT repeat protein
MATIQKPPLAGTAESGAVDLARVEKARDLLHFLSNTVSAMKIFPSEHATVRNFVDQLTQKFTDFLSAYQKLQIGIEEYSFTYGGRPVFSDELTIKSLPFFFFKDGLQIFFFYEGLDRQEILEFLELITAEAQKPAEDSDIVAALWERDFPNIQYYAPDEFLENRILSETSDAQARQEVPDLPADFAHETIEVRVDSSKFSKGKIELTSEDREEVQKVSARAEHEDAPMGDAAAEEDSGQERAAEKDDGKISPAAAMDPTLTEDELLSLESMVRTNRTISPQEEYINLMVEIIFLEEDLRHCQASLDALLEYHFDQLQHGNFHVAVLIIQKVHELGRSLAGDPNKAALLESFLKRTISPKMLEAVKDLLDKKKTLDWESLLGFFRLLGTQALSLAADLFDIVPGGEARHKILVFIADAGIPNPGLLPSLADNARPDLAIEIIGILSRIPGNRGIPHLSAFLSFQNKAVKLEAIHALGKTRDEMANRILLGFMKDPDEEVRIQAAMKLDPTEGGARVQQIVGEASARGFQTKSLKEKEAILSFLGRTRSPEALAFLRRTLEKAPFFAPKRLLEMRLAAGAGLESMGTEEALGILQKGAIGRTKKVREACTAALVRLPPAGGAKK